MATPLPISSKSLTPNLPILQKITESYKLWHGILPHLPRLSRYTLGQKINDLFIELTELTLATGYSQKEHKHIAIQRASVRLDTLKFFIQIAWELKALDNKKFAALSEPLVEIGKMLGGWQRATAAAIKQN